VEVVPDFLDARMADFILLNGKVLFLSNFRIIMDSSLNSIFSNEGGSDPPTKTKANMRRNIDVLPSIDVMHTPTNTTTDKTAIQ
jgi:hypothetical protein